MKKRFLTLTALALVATATFVSCKGKEGAADGTSADTTMVDTTTPPPAEAAPIDTTMTPADTTAMPAK
ncbi:hypothetical protein [Flavobacterium selenitireducens]|uniref:hypothetical protein n=1 Tax=Flavobacterium selenitireducens TaxID=2722704 RepID=UPI00168A404D|nr:hypothetical protein [Flavobacterium selenitireducens]MBD3581720.1 hypothetical protein [Flavobacterium selenitireducens]